MARSSLAELRQVDRVETGWRHWRRHGFGHRRNDFPRPEGPPGIWRLGDPSWPWARPSSCVPGVRFRESSRCSDWLPLGLKSRSEDWGQSLIRRELPAPFAWAGGSLRGSPFTGGHGRLRGDVLLRSAAHCQNRHPADSSARETVKSPGRIFWHPCP